MMRQVRRFFSIIARTPANVNYKNKNRSLLLQAWKKCDRIKKKAF